MATSFSDIGGDPSTSSYGSSIEGLDTSLDDPDVGQGLSKKAIAAKLKELKGGGKGVAGGAGEGFIEGQARRADTMTVGEGATHPYGLTAKEYQQMRTRDQRAASLDALIAAYLQSTTRRA